MTLPRTRTRHARLAARRGSTALEFALLAVPFWLFLLFQFELSYDFFSQEILDAALHEALRDIATGNAQNAVSGSAFVQSYLCPAVHGLLDCTNLWFNVTRLPSPLTANQDFYTYTTGSVPTAGGNTLNLANYASIASGGSPGSFCNSGPAEMILATAIYLGPTFIGGILPNLLSHRNYLDSSQVDATLSSAGIVTEPFTVVTPGSGITPAAAC